MTNFFEFEKKSSDGIRSKRSQAVPPARRRIQKPVEAQKSSVVSQDEPDIRIAAYEEEKREPISLSPRPTAKRTPAFIQEQDAGDAFLSGTEESDNYVLPEAQAQKPESKQISLLKTSRRNAIAARVRGIFALFSRKEDMPLSLSEEIQKDSKSKLLRWGVLCGVLALAAGGALLSFYFSRLIVTVNPALTGHELSDVRIIVDHKASEVSAEKNVLPAERLEFSRIEKGIFPATGQKYVEERAHGIVRIYNRFSATPQRLVASTRFVTDKGAVYRLTRAVTIPGAALEEGGISPRFAEAELAADKPGSAGNISGLITLKIPGFQGTPRYEGFYAEAVSGFAGGMTGESKVATKEDIARAEEEVTKKVYDAVKLEVAKKIPPDFKAVDGLREIEIIKVISPKVSAAGETFEVEAHAVGQVLVFREADISLALRTLFLQDKKDAEEIKNMSGIAYSVKSLDMQNGKAELALAGKVYLKSVIAERELAGILQGKKEQELIETLKRKTEIKDFSISLFPPWTFRAPAEVDRIRVIIKEN